MQDNDHHSYPAATRMLNDSTAVVAHAAQLSEVGIHCTKYIPVVTAMDSHRKEEFEGHGRGFSVGRLLCCHIMSAMPRSLLSCFLASPPAPKESHAPINESHHQRKMGN